MDAKQLKQEKMYLAAMHFIRGMLQKGLITKAEYGKAERQLRNKYSPVIGLLLADIDLL